MKYKREILEKFTVEDLQAMLHARHGSEKANCLYKAEAFNILAKHIDPDSKLDVVKESCIRMLCGHDGRKEVSIKLKTE